MADTSPEPEERVGGPETFGPAPAAAGDAWRRDLRLDEVSEEEASGEVADVFADIKETLRASVVDLVWRVFATKPKFLSSVWEELRPAVDGGLMEIAEGIRALAIERVRETAPVPDHREAIGGDLQDAVQQLRVFMEVNPRLLVLLCALDRSWRGEDVGGHRAGTPTERGVPRWHPEIRTAGANALPDVFDDMRDMLDLPAPDTDYRMLATWPDYLRRAWADLRSFVPTEPWRDVCRTVEAVADQGAVALPQRIRVSPHRAGEYGLAPDEAEEAGRWIAAFHGLLPGLVVNDSFFWIGLQGGTQRAPALSGVEAGRDESRRPA